MSVSAETLAAFTARLGYAFRNPALLREALTHASCLQDDPSPNGSNQRLEFLGDAVLHLIFSEQLFKLYPEEREGVLSRRRAALTKGVYLTQLARELSLASMLRLSPAEEQAGGRERDSILEDAFEAVIGAIYLDSDLSTTREIVLALYGPLPAILGKLEHSENPKGRLQELIQPNYGNDALRYEVTGTFGAAHNREFEVQVFLIDRWLGTGRGRSKKFAEEIAAQVALANWTAAPQP